MAIAWVSTSIGGAAGTSVTVSHTIASGSNTALITVMENQGGDNTTGITFNGTSMTQYVKLNTTIAGFYNYMYSLVNPTVTTANIVASSSVSATLIAISSNYTGVDQTTPLEANSSGATTSTNPSRSVTTLTDNAWLVSCIRINALPVVASTNTTDRGNWVSDVGFHMSDTNAAQTPTGSYAQNWTSANQLYAMIVASLKPAGAATPANTKFLSFM
jgi:hypothetical protein